MTSVFSARRDDYFATYAGTIEFRSRVYGGVPSDPKAIIRWIAAKAGVTQKEEILRMLIRTMAEQGVKVKEGDSFEDVMAAAEKVAAERNANVFKRDDRGLYIEERQLKAALREAVAVLYPWPDHKWGSTKKGARAYFAERVYVDPERLHLGVTEPTGAELCVGHVVGPQGARSTLTLVEYAQGARVDFTVRVLHDLIGADTWPEVWVYCEENGLGARRSQGGGRFDVVRWERLNGRH